MARVKIAMPQRKFAFSTQLPVLVQHVNYGGHLGNDAVLSLMHEARIRYLQHLECSELDAYGTGLIMVDVAIVYKAEGFQGDVLDVAVSADDFSSRGFDLYYKMSCVREKKKVTIAEAKTGMLCFDYQKRKPALLPDALRNQLTEGSGS